MQLNADRCATSAKLRKEWERRIDVNETAVNVLLGNLHLWNHVNGPQPDCMRRPSEADLADARSSAEALRRMISVHGEEKESLKALVEELCRAVDSLKQVSWSVIRVDRFSLTPLALYDALVVTAEGYIQRDDEEAESRRAFLAAPLGTKEDAEDYEGEDGEGEDGAEEPPLPGRGRDKYNLDLDADFRVIRPKYGWKLSVKQAGLVIIDDMRTLLDLHYDNVHLENWRRKEESARKRMQTRKSDFRVFDAVAYMHKRKPNVHVVLPKSIKDILQSPDDEKDS